MAEAWICDAVRTPIGRYGGALASVRPDDLAVVVLKSLMQRNECVDPKGIDEVLFGCANQCGEDNRNVARMAVLLAGLPESTPGVTVNRLCASGMDAVACAARAIRAGEADLCISGGVESMSRAPYVLPKSEQPFDRSVTLEDTTLGWRFVHPEMRERYGVDTMPETGEHVAEAFRISRADQDAFALRSQTRAQQAKQSGFFEQEIVAVSIPQRRGEPIVVCEDEHPRSDVTADKLARLRPYVKADGVLTAGNSSGINDGACAMFVASDAGVEDHGLTRRARVVATTSVGVAPRVMGIGPAPATQKLLQRTGVSLSDLGVIELNEAFASQTLAVLRELGLPDDAPHVNPNGGAIALGHPLGMTGARLIATAVNQLHQTDSRYALATLCVGVGQGVAMLLEKP
ncbi:MAG: 3-oxoadipyl-CoA thiolase [Planctomycetota bacterium]